METKDSNHHKCKLAVITGASSGIGYELARVFGQNGYDLLIVAEDSGISKAAFDLRLRGAQVQYAQIDLAKREGVNQFYKQIKDLGRPVDALAINAGVGVSGEFVDTAIDDEENLIKINILSGLRLSKLVLKDMVKAGQGKILFTSSIAAEMPGPYYAVHAASKAFVQSFAEALRFEVKDKGITVTALQPGATDTNFFARAGMLDTKAGQAEKDSPALVAQHGFDALMAGRDHVVAGSFKNKLRVGVGKMISEPMGAMVHSQDVKPGSAH